MNIDLTNPLAFAAGTAGAMATVTVIAYSTRRLARLRRLHAIRDSHPPLRTVLRDGNGNNTDSTGATLPDDAVSDPTPTWLSEFSELVAAARDLPTATRDLLDARYDAAVTCRLRRDLNDVIETARYTPRLEWAFDDLALLRMHCPAAELAAAAVLTRDLIDDRVFALLTSVWASADLPLPGGDVCPRFTALIERHDSGDQWTAFAPPEIVKSLVGESAAQIAEGMGLQLKAAQRDPRIGWRVCVWIGEIQDLYDSSGLFRSPPDAVYEHLPELVA